MNPVPRGETGWEASQLRFRLFSLCFPPSSSAGVAKSEKPKGGHDGKAKEEQKGNLSLAEEIREKGKFAKLGTDSQCTYTLGQSNSMASFLKQKKVCTQKTAWGKPETNNGLSLLIKAATPPPRREAAFGNTTTVIAAGGATSGDDRKECASPGQEKKAPLCQGGAPSTPFSPRLRRRKRLSFAVATSRNYEDTEKPHLSLGEQKERTAALKVCDAPHSPRAVPLSEGVEQERERVRVGVEC